MIILAILSTENIIRKKRSEKRSQQNVKIILKNNSGLIFMIFIAFHTLWNSDWSMFLPTIIPNRTENCENEKSDNAK